MSGGLLVGGKLVPVDGLEIIPPARANGPAWARLEPGDYRTRHSSWVHQIILHTTKGIHPQPILPGAGPTLRGRRVADFWFRSKDHSGAHLVVGSDGVVVCLADLLFHAAHHATVSNEFSVGIEIYQELGGGIHQAALAAAVKLVGAVADALHIPRQFSDDEYKGAPLERMEHDGGPDMVGVFGHRQNTERRGRGDPGDEIFNLLGAAGFEGWNYEEGEDLAVCKLRQGALNRRFGAGLVTDGICGPKTLAAAVKHCGGWSHVDF